MENKNTAAAETTLTSGKSKTKLGIWGVSADTVYHLPIGVSGRVEVRRFLTEDPETQPTDTFVLLVDNEVMADDESGAWHKFDTLAEVLDYFADLSSGGYFGEAV